MLTNHLRHWISRVRSQLLGKPVRRRRLSAWGYSERLEARTVLSAVVGTVSTTSLGTSDNTRATARDLGALSTTPTVVSDFVGHADTQDFTRFTLTRASDFRLRLSGLTADADVTLLDEQGRYVAGSTRGSNLPEDISCSLAAGTYFVRVYQYFGNTNYDLSLSVTETVNDDSLTTARDLGTITSATTTVNDAIGWSDTQDNFRFTIAQSSDVRMRLNGLATFANLILLDSQGRTITSSTGTEFVRALDAGTYFARVQVGGGSTSYGLSLSATPNDNSVATARVIGTLSATSTAVADAVSTADPLDYWRFTVAQTSDVSLRLSGLSGNADLQLLDAQGAVMASSARTANTTEDIHRTLAAGTYFARVAHQPTNATNYTLTLFAADVAPNDNSLATARDLGAISTATTTVRNFVGNADTQDFLRWTLTHSSDVTIRLNNLSADADVQILDAQGRWVASSARAGTQSEQMVRSLNAGTYFVRVYQYSGDTNYELTLSAIANDNSLASASDLGAVGTTPITVSNVIGNNDTQDYYRFTVSQPGSVTIRSSVTTTASVMELFDTQGRSIADSTGGGVPGQIQRTLDAGSYFVRVYQVSSSPDINYSLTLTMAASDNFLATARDLGTLGSTPLTVRDFVGSTDTQDYFRFSVVQSQNVSIRQTGSGYGTDLQLLHASGQVIASGVNVATATMGIDRVLEPGTYFVRAFQQYGEVNYDLTILVPLPVADDNSITTARDLGTLGSTAITVRDAVGNTDTQDYFRFTLNQTRSLSLRLTSLTADADVRILNAQGRTIGSSMRASNASEQINLTLSAGTYFVCVYQWSGNTNYDLTLS